jgi:uroporphyrinogen decarboxylase
MDLGGSDSSIHLHAYQRLIRLLNVNVSPQIGDKIQQSVAPDEEVLQILRTDFRHIGLKKGFLAIDGNDCHDRPSTRPYVIDQWGIKWEQISPYYYDMTNRPLENADLKDLENYDWPDPKDSERYEGLREQVKELYYSTDYAIVADAIYGGIFECALWLRGFGKFTIDMYKRPEFANALLDRILEIYMGIFDRYLKEVGEYVEIVQQSDDVGAQAGPLLSPVLLRKYLKPRWSKLYDFVHDRTKAKLYHHSCGSVYLFLEDFIESGVDILNPLQPRAAMMDIGRIKEKTGNRLVLHGGIDIQKILPSRSPSDVEAEVKRVLKAAGPGGGYILAASHNIQADTPPENIAAMFRACLKYGQYPLTL